MKHFCIALLLMCTTTTYFIGGTVHVCTTCCNPNGHCTVWCT